MNPIDIEKPELKTGETLCDGCWAVTKDQSNWLYMNFKHLKPVLLCPKCQEEHAEKFAKLQAYNL
jgi:hypothetical protein